VHLLNLLCMLEFYTALLVYLFFLASWWSYTFKPFSNLHFLDLAFFYSRDFFGIGFYCTVTIVYRCQMYCISEGELYPESLLYVRQSTTTCVTNNMFHFIKVQPSTEVVHVVQLVTHWCSGMYSKLQVYVKLKQCRTSIYMTSEVQKQQCAASRKYVYSSKEPTTAIVSTKQPYIASCKKPCIQCTKNSE